MLNFDIQGHKPLREIVYEELRDMILTGAIKPGSRMMEVELAESMGVSRTPIRESIRKLEKEGLVTIEPRKGAYASEISQQDMGDILDVRSTLEGMAAQLAAVKMDREEKKELLEISKKYSDAVKEANVEDIIRYDTHFHSLIVDGSKNNYLILMVGRLQEMVQRFRYIYYKDYKRTADLPAEHQIICEAILKGDGDTAKSEAVYHIDKLRGMILAAKELWEKDEKNQNENAI